jgi:hypothetical protein
MLSILQEVNAQQKGKHTAGHQEKWNILYLYQVSNNNKKELQ